MRRMRMLLLGAGRPRAQSSTPQPPGEPEPGQLSPGFSSPESLPVPRSAGGARCASRARGSPRGEREGRWGSPGSSAPRWPCPAPSPSRPHAGSRLSASGPGGCTARSVASGRWKADGWGGQTRRWAGGVGCRRRGLGPVPLAGASGEAS